MSPVLRKTTSDMLSFAPCPIRLAVCLLFAMPAAHALPSGATPTSGQTTVQQTSPKQLDIRQTTPRAGLDWTSFSIAAGERVLVSQPGRDSVLLNRVIGNDPSQILGSLQANGSVWLINPRGIVFGAGSQVDVGGLLASTLSLGELGGGSSNADFAAGRLSLGRTGNTPGSLRSEGSIRAPGGSVVLVAPQLSQGGSIEARRIGLAAATHVNVDVEGDGLIFFNARNDGSLDARLAQLGRLTADGGTAEMRAAARAGFADTVLNMDGVVQARSIGQRNGRVVIDGGRDGVTVVNGQVDVSGTAASGETGGQAQVLGQRVALTGNAVVDASGNAGGGAIRVGGDYQGHNPDLPNAQYTLIQPGASLRADAVAKGQGGSVIVWSDEGTRFLGNISARGGAQGGDGGFAEVSGKLGLDFRGLVDLTAARGQAGTLLLDPHDLTIQDSDPNLAGTADVDLSTATLAFNFPSGPVSAGVDGVQPTDVNSVITKGALNTQLNLAAVSLQAHNNITVAAPTNPPAGSGTATTISGPNSLTLQAGGTINIAASISTNGLTLSANDPGAAKTITTGSVITSAPLNAGTGNLSISNNPDGTGSHEIGADLSGATFSIVGNINLVANSTWTLGSGTSTIAGAIGGTGALTKAGAGSLTLGGVNTYTGATTVTEGELVLGRVNAINPASALVVTGGTLNLGANNNTVASVSLQGGTITGTDGVLTSSTNFDVQSGTVSAILDGAAVAAGAPAIGLTKTGAATSTVTLSRANLYSGATNVNGGTLAVGANGHLASTAIDVNAATATLALASGAAVNQLNDAAVVTVTSGGRFTVGSATTIQQLDLGGTLDGAGSLNATTSTALTGGTVSAQLATPALSSTGASAILASVSANTTTVTAGTLRISDPGTLDTPLLNLDNGSLTTVGNQRLTNPNSAVTIANGATLTLDGNESIGALADKTGQVDGTATVNLVGATSTLTLNNTTTFGGKISGSAGSTLVNAGANTLTVGATGQFNPGAIDLDAGSLSTTVNEQIGNTTRVNLVQGATLTLGGNETIGALSDKASATATGTASVDLGSHTLSVNTTPDTLATTFSGVISGVDGQLTKTGLGSLTLGGVNTYSGLTTVTGGTLAVGANGRLASTAINIDAATATLALASGAAVNQLNDTATVTVTNSGRFTVGSATTIQQLK
ncbi:MAG: hypothetical protein RLZZ584_1514, partial [Pseudomonadota bacterium]